MNRSIILQRSQAVDCCVIETADIGAQFGGIRRLNEARMRSMTVNRVHLLDLLDPSEAFVTELASPPFQCITWLQRDRLINTIQPRERSEQLMDLLSRTRVADFEKFINVLSKYQAHLVPLLLADGGESFCNVFFS